MSAADDLDQWVELQRVWVKMADQFGIAAHGGVVGTEPANYSDMLRSCDTIDPVINAILQPLGFSASMGEDVDYMNNPLFISAGKVAEHLSELRELVTHPDADRKLVFSQITKGLDVINHTVGLLDET